jgi:hypothetical protein
MHLNTASLDAETNPKSILFMKNLPERDLRHFILNPDKLW